MSYQILVVSLSLITFSSLCAFHLELFSELANLINVSLHLFLDHLHILVCDNGRLLLDYKWGFMS